MYLNLKNKQGWRYTMVATDHRTYVYVGLAGEGEYIGESGSVRRG